MEWTDNGEAYLKYILAVLTETTVSFPITYIFVIRHVRVLEFENMAYKALFWTWFESSCYPSVPDDFLTVMGELDELMAAHIMLVILVVAHFIDLLNV